ncbi:hypothetical protein TRVL_01136 [Trypanosoma vivax]|nr:hypothetical protein TRVL_01136 [Trypanosoma vivax]
MDFFRVLSQRQLDQSSEVYRILRVSLCYALLALLLSILPFMRIVTGSSTDVNVGQKGGFRRCLRHVTFVNCRVGGYLLLVKSLNTLCCNRFVVTHHYAAVRNRIMAFLLPGLHDRLTRRQRLFYVYGQPVVAVLCTCAGLVDRGYLIYVLLLATQGILFVFSWTFYMSLLYPLR